MMKSLYPVLAAALVLSVLPGCSLFHRKQAVKEPKPTNYLSNQVELQFEQRWKDKRVSDLVAQGMDPAKAKAQADADFAAQYSYAQPNPKLK